ncbi:MAG: hypothetical protein ACYC8T_12630 [Myxococcaceae bacterium]
MKRLLLSLVSLTAIAFGCGPMPESTSVSVADQPAALTNAGDDVLFTLTLSIADAPLAIADVNVHAGLAGQTATVVNFTHDDKNSDGKLDPGETLTTREPGVNLFDASHVGKPINIGFSEKQASGMWMTRANATWTPAQ